MRVRQGGVSLADVDGIAHIVAQVIFTDKKQSFKDRLVLSLYELLVNTQAAVPLCCAKGIFERYAVATDIASSGEKLRMQFVGGIIDVSSSYQTLRMRLMQGGHNQTSRLTQCNACTDNSSFRILHSPS